MDVLSIAFVCHMALQAYASALGQPDYPDWNDPGQIEKMVSGVEFALGNRDVPPETQHQAWIEYMALRGWLYGPVKSDTAKLHPSLVPWAQLPETEKVKDRLFQAIVKALAP